MVVAIAYMGWRLFRRLRFPLALDVSKLYEERNHADRLGFLTVFRREFRRRVNQMALMPAESLRVLPQYLESWSGSRIR
jgi:hypothetical protein